MATFTETVYIDVDASDFEDGDLIEELKSRGYYVSEEPDTLFIEHAWNRGDKKEALILLERKFPELRGISNLVD